MEKSSIPMLALVALAAYLAARYADSDVAAAPVAFEENATELAMQLDNLRFQQEQALARIGELELQIGRQVTVVTPVERIPEAELEDSGGREGEAEPQRRDPGLQAVQRIEQAGLTTEEFAAIESRSYELYLDGFEQEWLERRERYLAGERAPGSRERLREELGDDAYDRYLFASGSPNRVRVQRVLPGSAAERAGLSAGDVLLSYGGDRLYNFEDLRYASYRGDPGESVLMEVKRADGTISQFLIPRGPMGISGYGGWREAPGS